MQDIKLKRVADEVTQERASRELDCYKICNYGVSYLDRALIGIIPSDLVLIGAKTGIGKTEIALHIACENAKIGKRVAYVALEAEVFEISRRLKYKAIAKNYFNDKTRTFSAPLSYRLFRMNCMDHRLHPYEEMAEKEIADTLGNLFCYYKEEDFNITKLKQMFGAIKGEIDLLVIDHLHYFDTYDDNNNRELSQIMKDMRNLNLIYGIPIVLVAQLNKHLKHTFPDIEDFMGTSDIGKIATTSIMLSPNYENQDYKNSVFDTYIRICKSRLGNLSRLAASVSYDAQLNDYLDDFKLHKILPHGDAASLLEYRDWPEWAVGARKSLFSI